jgi:transcription elongation factor GreA
MEVVRPGCMVRIRRAAIEERWTIVPPHQADPLKRRLSDLSPLGFALTGHRIGDEVTVQTQGGRDTVTILDIEDVDL